MEKRLRPGQAEHLRGLLLALWHALDARAENFREIKGIIQDERDGRGEEPPRLSGRPRARAQEHARNIIQDQQLQHKRRAADDPDERPRQPSERLEAAHGAEGQQQPERKRSRQRDGKELERLQKAAVHGAEYGFDHDCCLPAAFRYFCSISAACTPYCSAGACSAPLSHCCRKNSFSAAAASEPLRKPTPYCSPVSAFSTGPMARSA